MECFTNLAVIVLELGARQVHKGYVFNKSGTINLSINCMCASKHSVVHVHMPTRFHRKFFSFSGDRLGDDRDKSIKKRYFSVCLSGVITV